MPKLKADVADFLRTVGAGGMAGEGFQVPPDAGHTILGAYGLRNQIVTWLIARYPELAQLTPRQLLSLPRPHCRWTPHPDVRACGAEMRLIQVPGVRGGPDRLAWRCSRHQPAEQRDFELPREATPKIALHAAIAATIEGKSIEWQRPRPGADFSYSFVAKEPPPAQNGRRKGGQRRQRNDSATQH